ncbi:hypothetical protein RHIZ404_200927 [Rhizobium sp. EC-SD404]|nr:hypothetical protein RHIZ404_200927 [Rhizobium sp. EC-SD404]
MITIGPTPTGWDEADAIDRAEAFMNFLRAAIAQHIDHVDQQGPSFG